MLTPLLLLLVSTSTLASLLPNATFRVEQTLGGLLSYYWQQDPNAKNTSFFFACGQIGALGTPDEWKHCSCYNSRSCTNCYRWWDAVAIEAIANHGIYSTTRNLSDIPDIVYAHSPYNEDFNATAVCTFIDDFAWYGIAYLRVYEWLKVGMAHTCLSLTDLECACSLFTVFRSQNGLTGHWDCTTGHGTMVGIVIVGGSGGPIVIKTCSKIL